MISYFTSKTPLPSVSSLQSQNLLQWASSLTGPGWEHWKGEPAAGLKVTEGLSVPGVVPGVVSAGVVSGAEGVSVASTGASRPQPATCWGQLQTLTAKFQRLRVK